VWFVQEALRRVTEVRHLRPSRDHVAGDLETRALSSASSSRSDPQLDGRQESAAGASSESKRAVALRHFSHRPRRIFRWREGDCRGRWSSPRP
jgi:hypothetical protein